MDDAVKHRRVLAATACPVRVDRGGVYLGERPRPRHHFELAIVDTRDAVAVSCQWIGHAAAASQDVTARRYERHPEIILSIWASEPRLRHSVLTFPA